MNAGYGFAYFRWRSINTIGCDPNCDFCNWLVKNFPEMEMKS